MLEIFTKSLNGMMLWFYIIVGATLAQVLIGPLTLSAGCSSTQVLAADPHALCSSNVRSKQNVPPLRITDSSPDSQMDCVHHARNTPRDRVDNPRPIRRQVTALQLQDQNVRSCCFSLPTGVRPLLPPCLSESNTKASRSVWIPAWIHLSLYIKFMKSDRPNIGIVPTIIAEVIWAAIALASASVPVLLKVAKRFTTPGMLVGEDISLSARPSRSRTKSTPNHSNTSGTAHSHGTDTTSTKRWSNGRQLSPATKMMPLRPDVEEDQAYTTSVLPGRRKSESFNSSAESQVGILREVQFEVSSHRVPSTSSLEN